MNTAENKPRVLETVRGYDSVIREMATFVRMFNECNGSGRMRFTSKSHLFARDEDGSGEYYEAVCLNSNEAQNSADEIYEIQTCW